MSTNRLNTLIGARIAERRRLFGLSQARLAERVRLQPETISRLERGHVLPSLAKILDVADALELELHELFRLRTAETPRDVALERLHRFATRLSVAEIELLMDLGALVFKYVRETKR